MSEDRDTAALGVLLRVIEKWKKIAKMQELLECGREPLDDFPVSGPMPGFIPWNPLAGARWTIELDSALTMFTDHIVHLVLNWRRWRGPGPTIRLLMQLKASDKEAWEIVSEILRQQPNGSEGFSIFIQMENHRRHQRANLEAKLAFWEEQ